MDASQACTILPMTISSFLATNTLTITPKWVRQATKSPSMPDPPPPPPSLPIMSLYLKLPQTKYRTWNCERKIKRKFLGGSRGMLPLIILKVETKVSSICGILEANLKRSSTLKFIMNTSFALSICIQRSIILIFIGKKYACHFFPTENIFSVIFNSYFRKNPRFHDEFQALKITLYSKLPQVIPKQNNSKPKTASSNTQTK